ncbi:polyisoprenoid-binding protein YceI [Streptomyces clavifer]|uniref:Polyisoprenoid-binding protein YceI n=2 Tax=Streptomyces TaxID=1883 RepID=A0ABS4V3G9_9ACTN|nr:polyisoprenoid-binding protein YceI [Streptomyces clavifer]
MTMPALTDLTGTYVLDPVHTRIGFVARHAMITKVRGAFHEFEGTLHLDGSDPAKSRASVSIQADSIDTGNGDRDGHLRTNDFLDAPNHPRITFASTKAEQVDDTHFRLTGDLTIKGTSKSISIDFEFTGAAQDSFGNQRVGFEGAITVSRKDYGLTWNAALEGGGVLVGDKVVLEFDISAIKQV